MPENMNTSEYGSTTGKHTHTHFVMCVMLTTADSIVTTVDLRVVSYNRNRPSGRFTTIRAIHLDGEDDGTQQNTLPTTE